METNPTQVYQLKITLAESTPPIWRRVLVPGNTTLLNLHRILQITLGWAAAGLMRASPESIAIIGVGRAGSIGEDNS